MPIDPKMYKMLLETFKVEFLEQHRHMVDVLINLEKIKAKKEVNEALSTLFRISHNLKGSAKSVAMDKLAGIAHQLEDMFSIWRESNTKPEKKEITTCLALVDKMVAIFESTQAETSISNIHEVIKVSSNRVERVNAKINDLVIFQLILSRWIKSMHGVLYDLNQLNDEGFHAIIPVKNKLRDILEDSDKFSGEFASDLFTLQQEGRMMQLVAIEHLLLPLKRTVREMAEQEDKEIELIIEGTGVEIDKSILEALKAPLQHLIRNAVAHGVETVSDRKKHNKPLPAKLLICVTSSAGKIKLTLSDDGQGIDVDKLKRLAVEKKYYTKNDVDNMTEQEALRLIFHSGLSTADHVSELSGRGVGLDAVWADVQKVKGDIKVDSTWGQGCCFTLTLPLALASARGLFVRLGTSTFMLPTLSVNALHEVRYESLKRIDNQWTVIINHVPVAVCGLSNLLGLGASEFDPNKRYDGILVGHDQSHIMILVDEIIEEHDVVIKPLPFPLNKLQHVSGVTLIEGSELVFVLNIEHLIHVGASTSGVIDVLNAEIKTEQKTSEAEIRVLVVDDALTTRTLAVNALRSVGYEVMAAVNGQNAWELLQDNTIDCVVTDIEMPVMDGFELTQAMKKDEKLKQTPIIIVSSLDNEKDKQRGLEVGANAYLVKKEFDTRTLINMVASLL